jgi:hypothetical protein
MTAIAGGRALLQWSKMSEKQFLIVIGVFVLYGFYWFFFKNDDSN